MPNVRIRYSLLSLLILTALVAGGVKLWHGPHHVVEQLCENVQQEYSYIRALNGSSVLDGVRISRSHSLDRQVTKYSRFDIQYVRNGILLPWRYMYLVIEEGKSTDFPWYKRPLTESPLSPEEQALFKAAIDRERQRLPTRGRGFKEFEHCGPPFETND